MSAQVVGGIKGNADIFNSGVINARSRPSKQVLPFWVNPKDISYGSIKLDWKDGFDLRAIAPGDGLKEEKNTTQRTDAIQPFCFISPFVQPAS